MIKNRTLVVIDFERNRVAIKFLEKIEFCHNNRIYKPRFAVLEADDFRTLCGLSKNEEIYIGKNYYFNEKFYIEMAKEIISIKHKRREHS